MNRVVILSGGTGSRAGGNIPKQYMNMDGRMMINRVIGVFAGMESIDTVRVVAGKKWQEAVISGMSPEESAKLEGFSEPGANRALSIWNALRDMKDVGEEDIVIIHDAARPFVSRELIGACIEACADHEGAMPGIPLKDTAYLCEEGKIAGLPDRDRLMAGQAPEAFRLRRYMKAVEALLPERILSVSGSAQMAVMDGMDVAVIPGDEKNVKITTAEDVKRFLG